MMLPPETPAIHVGCIEQIEGASVPVENGVPQFTQHAVTEGRGSCAAAGERDRDEQAGIAGGEALGLFFLGNHCHIPWLAGIQ